MASGKKSLRELCRFLKREGISHEVKQGNGHYKVWVRDHEGKRHLMVISQGSLSDKANSFKTDVAHARKIMAGRIPTRAAQA